MMLTSRVLRSYLRNVYVYRYCSAVVKFVAVINKICETLVDKCANCSVRNGIRSSDRSVLLRAAQDVITHCNVVFVRASWWLETRYNVQNS